MQLLSCNTSDLFILFFLCQQLVIALSNITSLNNQDFWPRVNEVHNGSANLLQQLEKYLVKIATVMPQAQSSPFEAVSESIGELVLEFVLFFLSNFAGFSGKTFANNLSLFVCIEVFLF